MNKKIIVFYVALAVLCVTSFGFINWNDSKTDQVETSVSEAVTINTPTTEKVNKRTYSGLGCNGGPNQLQNSPRPPYLAVVPEKQAEYEGGKDALMEYLKENSKEARGRQLMDELQPFKLLFTVTKEGAVENAKLDGTSGYIAIDNTMIRLIGKAPGKWEPAENSKGEKVDHELVVSFGLTGC